MQQVYLKTAITAKAEEEVKRHILANPFPLVKHIPKRLFNMLLTGIKNFEAAQFIENGIPYKKEIDGSVIEYTLKLKE